MPGTSDFWGMAITNDVYTKAVANRSAALSEWMAEHAEFASEFGSFTRQAGPEPFAEQDPGSGRSGEPGGPEPYGDAAMMTQGRPFMGFLAAWNDIPAPDPDDFGKGIGSKFYASAVRDWYDLRSIKFCEEYPDHPWCDDFYDDFCRRKPHHPNCAEDAEKGWWGVDPWSDPWHDIPPSEGGPPVGPNVGGFEPEPSPPLPVFLSLTPWGEEEKGEPARCCPKGTPAVKLTAVGPDGDLFRHTIENRWEMHESADPHCKCSCCEIRVFANWKTQKRTRGGTVYRNSTADLLRHRYSPWYASVRAAPDSGPHLSPFAAYRWRGGWWVEDIWFVVDGKQVNKDLWTEARWSSPNLTKAEKKLKAISMSTRNASRRRRLLSKYVVRPQDRFEGTQCEKRWKDEAGKRLARGMSVTSKWTWASVILTDWFKRESGTCTGWDRAMTIYSVSVTAERGLDGFVERGAKAVLTVDDQERNVVPGLIDR